MIRRDLNKRFDFQLKEQDDKWQVCLLPKWGDQGTNVLDTFSSLGEAEEYCRKHQGLEQIPWKCSCGSKSVHVSSSDKLHSAGPIMQIGYVKCYDCFSEWKDHIVREELLKK